MIFSICYYDKNVAIKFYGFLEFYSVYYFKTIMLSFVKMRSKSLDVIHPRTTLKNLSHNTRTRLFYNQETRYEICVYSVRRRRYYSECAITCLVFKLITRSLYTGIQ